MNRHTIIKAVALAMVVLPLPLGALPRAAAQPGADSIRVTGTVRDFRTEHPDFGVTSDKGYGHHAGMVGLQFSDDVRPALTESGFEVASQWRERLGHPIAPHLYRSGEGGAAGPLTGFQGAAAMGTVTVMNGGEIRAAPGVTLRVLTNASSSDAGQGQSALIYVSKTNSIIDGDVYVGPGGDPATEIAENQGGVVTGAKLALEEPVPFPPIPVPDLGPSAGEVVFTGLSTLDADLHADSVLIQPWGTLLVKAPVRVVCDSSFSISNNCNLVIAPGGSLEVYILGGPRSDGTPGSLFVENACAVNVLSGDPGLVSIYHLGSADVFLENLIALCGNIYAPDAKVTLENGVQMWGNVVAERLTVKQAARLTVKGTFGGGIVATEDVCGVTLNDSAGLKGVDGMGAVTSPATFGSWYADILGTNLATAHSITLVNDGAGIYQYLSDAFYPIDGRLFGNEGREHNYHFTFGFAAPFTYEACAGQFFEFEGADDAWLYVDEQLAMDLGGVFPGTEQFVPLDRLDLVDGRRYTLHFFFAQRNNTESVFRVRTNLDLGGTDATVSAGYD